MTQPEGAARYGIPDVRTKLDGGLNSRSNVFQVRPDQVVAVQNFRGDEAGSLHLRDGSLLAVSPLYPALTAGGITNLRSQAPIISNAGGAGIAAGTYEVKLGFVRWGGPAVANRPDIGFSLGSNALVLGAPANILIRLYGSDLGEGVGNRNIVATPPHDDPFMGGLSSTQVYVAVRKNSGNWEGQGALSSFTYNVGSEVWELTLTAYVSGTDVNPADVVAPQPTRKLFFFETPKLQISVQNNRFFSGTTPWGISVDKSGNRLEHFSNSPTPIDMAVVQRTLVMTDGLRPKKARVSILGLASSITSQNSIVMLGANPPNAVPTLALGAAGVLTGDYKYRMTFIYRHKRPSNPVDVDEGVYSESATVESGVIAATADQIVVTINALMLETGLYKVRLYRTVAGGSTFYRLIDLAPGTVSVSDNTTDATINTATRKRDPDDAGPPAKDPLDVPPQSLILIAALGQRLIGVVGQSVRNAPNTSGRAITVEGTNVIRVSLEQLPDYPDPNGNDSPEIEFSIDHWPDLLEFRVTCGDDAPIRDRIVYRNQVFIFKDQEIGLFTGDKPGEFDYETLYTDVGAIRNSVINVGAEIYFWNAEKGGYVFDGRTYRWLGYDIQPTWAIDRALGYYCSNVIHDRMTNEIRWSFTEADVDPNTAQLNSTQSNIANVRGLWKEYVFSPENNAWFIFNGSSNGRDVRASVNAIAGTENTYVANFKAPFLGSTLGIISQEHAAQKDALVSTTVAVTASATFQFNGLDGEWDWVKLFKLIELIYVMGTATAGTVTVSARYLSNVTWTVIGTLTGPTVGFGVFYIDIPDKLADNVSLDRGMQIKIDSTVDCNLVIQGFICRHKPQTPAHRTVRP